MRGSFFSRGDFSWEGGGTIPQYRYKSFKDLIKAAL